MKNDSFFPKYNYTQEMFNEDKKIARIAFYYHFKWLFQDSINYSHPLTYGYLTKDDFIHIAIIALYRFRPKFNPEKAKYKTVGRKVAKRAMNHLLLSKNAQYKNRCVSMDKTIFEDEDDEDSLTTYENTLHNKPINWANVMYYENVIDTALEAKFYKQHLEPIVGYFVNGYKQVDIADKMKVSEPYISKVIKKFQTLAQEVFPNEIEVKDFYKLYFDDIMDDYDEMYLLSLTSSIDDLIINK